MCDKMAISAYILKIVENDPFFKASNKSKEMFNRHQYLNQSFTNISSLPKKYSTDLSHFASV